MDRIEKARRELATERAAWERQQRGEPDPEEQQPAPPMLLEAEPDWRNDVRRASDSESIAEWAARNGFSAGDLSVLGGKEILALNRAWKADGAKPSLRQLRAQTDRAKRDVARSGSLRDARAAIEAMLDERER